MRTPDRKHEQQIGLLAALSFPDKCLPEVFLLDCAQDSYGRNIKNFEEISIIAPGQGMVLRDV